MTDLNAGMDPKGAGSDLVLSAWWCNRFWYIPIALVILTGFFCGAHLTFNLYFNVALHDDGLYSVPEARYYLHLFGAGVLGASLYCTFLFASDANSKMYTGVKLPTAIDPFGFLIYIIGGGVTGLVLYCFAVAGILVAATNGEEAEVRPVLAGLLAFAGGYVTDGVKGFLIHWFKKVTSSMKGEG